MESTRQTWVGEDRAPDTQTARLLKVAVMTARLQGYGCREAGQAMAVSARLVRVH